MNVRDPIWIIDLPWLPWFWFYQTILVFGSIRHTWIFNLLQITGFWIYQTYLAFESIRHTWIFNLLLYLDFKSFVCTYLDFSGQCCTVSPRSSGIFAISSLTGWHAAFDLHKKVRNTLKFLSSLIIYMNYYWFAKKMSHMQSKTRLWFEQSNSVAKSNKTLSVGGLQKKKKKKVPQGLSFNALMSISIHSWASNQNQSSWNPGGACTLSL